ncbi:general secretion pathway protein GspB [Oceanicoccus sp. KOV_DT_Chl]|uniref:general secretion pathway protein GspB n=1 Tax=Oceanicoccus sp. KOV_DT_Chl TaxID=1904639 RepID=UPI000C7E5C3D|nr:general secretion pathway protein GspB [Oceanicoccus sp. KOV_DT_Chl]
MSYILDALKKSEQERQQNSGPGIQTVHKPHVLIRSANSVTATTVIVSSLVVMVGLLGGWLYFTSGNAVSITVAPATEKTAIASPAPVAEVTKPVTDPEAVAASAQVATLDTVLEFWELPDPIQQAIPAMTFSFHVYSDNPARRTIIINKRRVKEGDLIAQGLQLEEITAQGVVFNWQQQHRFSINVVENW